MVVAGSAAACCQRGQQRRPAGRQGRRRRSTARPRPAWTGSPSTVAQVLVDVAPPAVLERRALVALPLVQRRWPPPVAPVWPPDGDSLIWQRADQRVVQVGRRGPAGTRPATSSGHQASKMRIASASGRSSSPPTSPPACAPACCQACSAATAAASAGSVTGWLVEHPQQQSGQQVLAPQVGDRGVLDQPGPAPARSACRRRRWPPAPGRRAGRPRCTEPKLKLPSAAP